MASWFGEMKTEEFAATLLFFEDTNLEQCDQILKYSVFTSTTICSSSVWGRGFLPHFTILSPRAAVLPHRAGGEVLTITPTPRLSLMERQGIGKKEGKWTREEYLRWTLKSKNLNHSNEGLIQLREAEFCFKRCKSLLFVLKTVDGFHPENDQD